MDSLLTQIASRPTTSYGLDVSSLRQVWRGLCAHIADTLSQRRGVTIPGWCTFTIRQLPPPIPGGARVLEPVFFFLPAYLGTYGISPAPGGPLPSSTSLTPQTVVNWVSVAAAAGVSKDVCKNVVTEIARRVGDSSRAGQPLRLDFGACVVALSGSSYSSRFAPLGSVPPPPPPAPVPRISPASAPSRGMGGLGASAGTPPRPPMTPPAPPRGYPTEDEAGVEDEEGDEPSAPALGPAAAAQRAAREKRRRKALRRQERMAVMRAAWDAQAAAKRKLLEDEAAADAAVARVAERFEAEAGVRERERAAMARAQSLSVSSANATLAMTRSTALRPRAEPMGDFFDGKTMGRGRAAPPDLATLREQIEEKAEAKRAAKEAEAAAARAKRRIDPAVERAREAAEERARRDEMRRALDDQVARRAALGPHLPPPTAADTGAAGNFFFSRARPLGAEERALADAAEAGTHTDPREWDRLARSKARREQAALLERNLADVARCREAQRMQAEADAAYDREAEAAHAAAAAARAREAEEQKRATKEALRRAWRDDVAAKAAEKAAEKERYVGWKDQLPFKNDSSDDDTPVPSPPPPRRLPAVRPPRG